MYLPTVLRGRLDPSGPSISVIFSHVTVSTRLEGLLGVLSIANTLVISMNFGNLRQ
jgi:hypothetical protein